jgi:hypothetical protein
LELLVTFRINCPFNRIGDPSFRPVRQIDHVRVMVVKCVAGLAADGVQMLEIIAVLISVSAHHKFPAGSTNRDYDVFEELPDGSTI